MQQIECFLEVVKCSSFSAAAANLFMSQPTLSRNIISLEQELEVSLFNRANNTVRLTDMGRALYPKLQAMEQAFLSDSQELYEIIRNFSGRLRLGIQEPLSVDPLLCKVLNLIMQEHPQANITLKSVEVTQSYTQLLSGKIDLLVAVNDTIPNSELIDCLTIYQDQMCLAVPADHPNAGISEIASSDIGKMFPDLPLKLIDIKEFETTMRSGLYDLVDDRGIRPNEFVRGEDASISSFRLMSETSLGLTFFTQTSLMGNNNRVKLIPLWTCDENGKRPQMTSKDLFWRRSSENLLVPRFLDLIREKLAAGTREL